MSWVLYVACAVSVALVVASAAYVVHRKREVVGDPVLASVGETKTTLLLCALLVGVSLLFCWAKLDNPALAGEGDTSWLVVAGVSVALTAIACLAGVFSLLSVVVATEKGIESRGAFGNVSIIAWRDVARVKPSTLSKVVKIESVDGRTISVNSAMPSFSKFVEVAQEKTRKKQGREQLEDLERLLAGKR